MLILSNAKINIGLEILNKRDDGYHNINTFFYKIPLFDEIIIEKSSNFQFTFNSTLSIPNEKNLAYLAAIKIKELCQLDELPVSIIINKRIPAGGGLGGGSSNAANVLTGLNNFFQLEISKENLLNAGLSIGSDVPFFINSGNAAIAGGRGEEIEEIDLKLPFTILLVLPDLNISTAKAFSLLERDITIREMTNYSQYLSVLNDQPKKIGEIFKNDFEESIFKLHPELETIKEELHKYGAVYASMSGSGSTMYGFFEDTASANNAMLQFKHYKTHICNTIE